MLRRKRIAAAALLLLAGGGTTQLSAALTTGSIWINCQFVPSGNLPDSPTQCQGTGGPSPTGIPTVSPFPTVPTVTVPPTPTPVGTPTLPPVTPIAVATGLSLTASTTIATLGQTVTFTASSSAGPAPNIVIYDHSTGTALASCASASVCTASTSSSVAQTHAFIAYAAQSLGSGDPPPAPQATSRTVVVSWTTALVPSDGCAIQPDVLFDGYVGAVYLRLRLQSDSSGVRLCYRMTTPSGASEGGSILDGGGAPAVHVDNNIATCAGSANAVPSPHPELGGSLLGTTFSLDTFADGTGDAWICAQAGSVQERIGLTAPLSVAMDPAVPPAAPLPVAPPAGYPSSTCIVTGAAAATRAIVGQIGEAVSWLSEWSTPMSSVDICARTEDEQSTGRLLSFGAASLSVPSVTTSTNTTPCTFPLGSLTSPVAASLSSSPPGSEPLVVCATAAGTATAISVAGPSLGVPMIEKDPGGV